MKIVMNENTDRHGGGHDDTIEDALRFHQSLPGYRRTPLCRADAIARRIGVRYLSVKDEGARFGIKAFKSLGASYAIYQILKKMSGGSLEPQEFFSDEGRYWARNMAFTCATDGNHGRAVAWVARHLGRPAFVYMPGGAVPARIQAIESEGAVVTVIDGGYDEAVRHAADAAVREGRTVIADVGYPGYTDIPLFIQEGYQTIFAECRVQLQEGGVPDPDCVFIQAGVGAFAAAAATFYFKGDTTARLVSVEPERVGCLLHSVVVNDGKPHGVPPGGETIMAGLNCETPSTTAWPLIRDRFDAFMTIEDSYAEEAMRLLAHEGIVAGESGAASLGGMLALCRETRASIKERLGMHPDASVLIINTEADTDPDGYRRIVGFPAEKVTRRTACVS